MMATTPRVVREGYAITLDLANEEGNRIIVRIRPSGEVEFAGSLSDAARAFYLAVGDVARASQSQELRQMREELATVKGALAALHTLATGLMDERAGDA